MSSPIGTAEAADPRAFWGIGAALGLGIVWAMGLLPVQWFMALAVGFVFLFLVVTSGRAERFLLGLLFLLIPINPDFRIGMARYVSDPALAGTYTPMLNLSCMDIVLGALYVLWAGRVLIARGAVRGFFWPAGAWLILGLTGWAALSMLNAADPVLSLFLLAQFAKALLLYLYLANNLKSDEDFGFVARCMLVGLVAESLITCAQYAAGDNFGLDVLGGTSERKEMLLGGVRVFRPGGTVGHPNALGGYIASILPLVLALRFTLAPRRWQWIGLAGLGLGSIALVLTFSRSAWLAAAMACGGVMAWLFLHARRRVRWLPVLGAGLLLALILSAFLPQIAGRWLEDDEGSTLSRLPQTQIALEMVRQHPFLGVGLNNYGRAQHLYDVYVDSPDRLHRVYVHQVRLHNIFLLLAAEIGLVGLLFLGVFLWMLAANARRLLRGFRGDFRTQMILLGVALGLAARILHDAAHTGHLATSPVFWIFAAMLAARPALQIEEGRSS